MKRRAAPRLPTLDESSQYVNNAGGAGESAGNFCFGAREQPACLSRELNQMPMKDREQVSQDIYGTADTSDYDYSGEKMEEFWAELDKLGDKKAGYDMAFELSPEFARDPALPVAFIRSVKGDAKKAAKRYARHFKTKLELFGPDKLVKHIEIDDLDEDDMEAMNSGGFQVLPNVDRAGRPILFGRYTCMKYKTIMNMVCSPAASMGLAMKLD